MFDLAISGDEATGDIVVHTANCPQVRKLAEQGRPVLTMFGCEKIPDIYKQHECVAAVKE